MRVLHLTRDYPPRINGGLSTAVGGMVDASRNAGTVCAVLSFDAWRPIAQAQTRAPTPSPQDGGRLLRLSTPAQLEAAAAFATAFSPDLIHVHHAMLWDFGEALAKGQVPMLKSIHLLQQHMNALRGIEAETMSQQAQERAFQRAARLIAPSQAVFDWLARERPACRDRLRLAPLGVADRPAPIDSQRPPGSILYAGRFADINGTAELFRAIGPILEARPEASFTIAGGQPENRRSERRWLKRFADWVPEEHRGRVRFSGWLAPDDLCARYDSHTIQLVPSWFETFGQTALEGMGHGLCVVASRAGALPELIRHGGTGWLVAPRDTDGLVEAVLALLEDPARMDLLGRQAAMEVRENWLWAQRIGEMLAIYEELT